MSGSTSARPGWAVGLLAICLLALALHFVGESVTHAAAPLVDASHPEYDTSEDQFVLAASTDPTAASRGAWGAPPLLKSPGQSSLAPPSPPPDL
jgi:hypothetical protein